MPWYIKFLWIMFEITNPICLLITIAYYGLLTPGTYTQINGIYLSFTNILVNFVNVASLYLYHYFLRRSLMHVSSSLSTCSSSTKFG